MWSSLVLTRLKCQIYTRACTGDTVIKCTFFPVEMACSAFYLCKKRVARITHTVFSILIVTINVRITLHFSCRYCGPSWRNVSTWWSARWIKPGCFSLTSPSRVPGSRARTCSQRQACLKKKIKACYGHFIFSCEKGCKWCSIHYDCMFCESGPVGHRNVPVEYFLISLECQLESVHPVPESTQTCTAGLSGCL